MMNLVAEWRKEADARSKSADQQLAEGNIREADRCVGIMGAYRYCADKLEAEVGEQRATARICVVVRGGIVADVFCDRAADVVIVDFDNDKPCDGWDEAQLWESLPQDVATIIEE